VSKFNGDLTSLLASTFLGGSAYEEFGAIALDSSGNIYVSGRTSSSNFPITAGAYDTLYNGGGDAFVSRLNGDLTGLLTSTYLGGGYDDICYSLAVDSDRNLYMAGFTYSPDFPTTVGAYDTSFNSVSSGYPDVFISKINGDLTNLLASTYLGGIGEDHAYGITRDSGGNVYVVGGTFSLDFPTTPGAYDTSFNGYIDVFVSKFDSNLSAQITPTPAEVDIKPETINLKSKGSFKAFIKLPSPYDVNKIITGTVECEGAEAIDGKVGKDRFIATFKRQDLDLDSDEELTVTGELEGGTKFEGSDIVKIIK